jgi:hypothetical protein
MPGQGTGGLAASRGRQRSPGIRAGPSRQASTPGMQTQPADPAATSQAKQLITRCHCQEPRQSALVPAYLSALLAGRPCDPSRRVPRPTLHAVSIAATRLYHTPAVSRGGHGRNLQELVHVGNLGGTGASEAATARSGSASRPGGSPSSDGESWRESEAMGTERFLNSYHNASTPPGPDVPSQLADFMLAVDPVLE